MVGFFKGYAVKLKTIFYLTFMSITILLCFFKVGYPDFKGDVYSSSGEIYINRMFLEIEDGDTVIYKGDYIRFLGVDTPEIKNSEVGIFEDQPYGREAKEFVRRQIMQAKRVTFIPVGVDRYGRTLAHLFVDGYPLSLKIVEYGYGYETITSFGDNGFPDIAERILNAAKLHKKLPFENPWLWRKRHQIKHKGLKH